MLTQITEFAANHPLLTMAFIALLALTVLNEVKIATRNFTSLTPKGAVQLMNNEEDNLLILDVREPSETAGGKITRAKQIPVGSVSQRIGEIEKHRDKHVIVYCKNGTRSGIACKDLGKAGFNHVYNLSGGITAWQEEHLPLSKK